MVSGAIALLSERWGNMSTTHNCPRCGDRSLEKLNSYSHCPNCLYFEDRWRNPETPYLESLKAIDEIERAQNKLKIKMPRKERNETKNCA